MPPYGEGIIKSNMVETRGNAAIKSSKSNKIHKIPYDDRKNKMRNKAQ